MSDKDQIAALIDQINNMPSWRGVSDAQWSAIASELPTGYSLGVQTFGSALVYTGSGGTVYGWDGAQTSTFTDSLGPSKGAEAGSGVEIDIIKANGPDTGGSSWQVAIGAVGGEGASVPSLAALVDVPYFYTSYGQIASWLADTAPNGSSYFMTFGYQAGVGAGRSSTTVLDTGYPNGFTVNPINFYNANGSV